MSTRNLNDYETATGDEKIGANFSEGGGVLKLLIVLVAVIGGLVLGFGFLFRSVEKPMQDARTSALQEQTAMMREAVQMAREAQQISRQRMDELHRLQMGEGEYAGAEQYVSPEPYGD